MNILFPFDSHIIELTGKLRNPLLNTFMAGFTDLGSGSVILFLVIIAAIIFYMLKKYDSILILLTTFAGGEILVSVLKHTIGRARPEILTHLTYADGFSFPSGHSFASFTFFVILGYLMTREMKNIKVKIGIWLCISVIVLAIGFSRVYLGIHWPSDILGAWVISLAWQLLVIYFFPKMRALVSARLYAKINR